MENNERNALYDVYCVPYTSWQLATYMDFKILIFKV